MQKVGFKLFDEHLNPDRPDTSLISGRGGLLNMEKMIQWKLELLFPQFIGDHNRLVAMWVWRNRALQVIIPFFIKELGTFSTIIPSLLNAVRNSVTTVYCKT